MALESELGEAHKPRGQFLSPNPALAHKRKSLGLPLCHPDIMDMQKIIKKVLTSPRGCLSPGCITQHSGPVQTRGGQLGCAGRALAPAIRVGLGGWR